MGRMKWNNEEQEGAGEVGAEGRRRRRMEKLTYGMM